MYVKLNCKDCELDKCNYASKYPINKEGCTRFVTEEDAARFQHYTQEVIPFWKNDSFSYVKKSYIESIDFLFDKVYSAPLGQKINKYGKILDKK